MVGSIFVKIIKSPAKMRGFRGDWKPPSTSQFVEPLTTITTFIRLYTGVYLSRAL